MSWSSAKEPVVLHILVQVADTWPSRTICDNTQLWLLVDVMWRTSIQNVFKSAHAAVANNAMLIKETLQRLTAKNNRNLLQQPVLFSKISESITYGSLPKLKRWYLYQNVSTAKAFHLWFCIGCAAQVVPYQAVLYCFISSPCFESFTLITSKWYETFTYVKQSQP